MGNGKGEVDGILIARKEVRVADNCVQTLLKIQTLANLIQQLTEGKMPRRETCSKEGRKESPESVGEMKLGRLLINTEI